MFMCQQKALKSIKKLIIGNSYTLQSSYRQDLTFTDILNDGKTDISPNMPYPQTWKIVRVRIKLFGANSC